MSILSSASERLHSVFKKDAKTESNERPQEHEAVGEHRAAAHTLWEIGVKACRGDDEKMDVVYAVRKEILGDPDFRHKTRLVVDHFDYIMNLPMRLTPKGAKMTPAAAMRFAANCTRRRGLTREQERALAYLEASQYMWTEGMTLPMKAFRYPSGTRELVAKRPQDVLRIIAVARAHPEATRPAEIEALLSGESITPLVSGVL